MTTASATTPVVQAPVPSQTQPVPSEPSPNSPSTPPKLTPAAELRARTPQIPTPPLDPAPPPLLSKPRERNAEPEHPTSNSYGANKAPELTAQPGVYHKYYFFIFLYFYLISYKLKSMKQVFEKKNSIIYIYIFFSSIFYDRPSKLYSW